MKPKLLAIAILLGSLGAGRIVFVNWTTGVEDTTFPDTFGGLENYDKSRCVVTACNTLQCAQARNHLDDAGQTNALLREVECPFRVGQRARDDAADAGFALGPETYQQLRLTAMRKPGVDGGFVFGFATKDNGWPLDAMATGVFPCAWKPTPSAACTWADGGAIVETRGDGGWAPITKLEGRWAGAGCIRKACIEMAGDSSAP